MSLCSTYNHESQNRLQVILIFGNLAAAKCSYAQICCNYTTKVEDHSSYWVVIHIGSESLCKISWTQYQTTKEWLMEFIEMGKIEGYCIKWIKSKKEQQMQNYLTFLWYSWCIDDAIDEDVNAIKGGISRLSLILDYRNGNNMKGKKLRGERKMDRRQLEQESRSLDTLIYTIP